MFFLPGLGSKRFLTIIGAVFGYALKVFERIWCGYRVFYWDNCSSPLSELSRRLTICHISELSRRLTSCHISELSRRLTNYYKYLFKRVFLQFYWANEPRTLF